MLKFTAAQLQVIGATNHEQAADKIAGVFAIVAGYKTQIEALEKTNGELSAKLGEAAQTISAQDKTIKDLTATVGNPATLTEAKIRDIASQVATAKGSEAAIAAVAGIGAGSPVPAAAAGAQATETGSKPLIAAGKFEEAWAADKNIQAEFPDAKGYAAFMRAQAKGQIRIANK